MDPQEPPKSATEYTVKNKKEQLKIKEMSQNYEQKLTKLIKTENKK